MPGVIKAYVKWVDAFSDAVGIVTMYTIFLMIGVLLWDAISKNVLNIPQYWSMEVAQFTLAAYYTVGGAYSLRQGAHVRMDVIYDRLSDVNKARLDVVTDLLMLVFLIVLLIGSISSALYSWQVGQSLFSMWSPSLIPIKFIMVAGIVLMILQAVSTFFKDIAKARGVAIV